MSVAFYDTKPYDQLYFSSENKTVAWHFHEFRLEPNTVSTAQGVEAVCLFVNDVANCKCLEKLASFGVKLIALRCAGYNNVDLKAARTLGLSVVRVPAYSPHAVAEHAVALLLTLNRKIHRAYNRVREHNFSLNGLVGFDLCHKTAGIIGTGKIGKIAAQIFRGFQMKVIAYDVFPSPEWAEPLGVNYTDLDSLLSMSDVISLHIPLLPETHHLLNAKTLAKTKPGVFLINTSRGKVIETHALIEFLKSGHLGGVALDVYEEEEGIFFKDLSDQMLQDDELTRLLTFPNVLVTAHQAFLTHEALQEIARVTQENITRFVQKQSFLEGTVL
ncbi:MAG: 2-hydroxyacid dehydrogenase [Verrucomicrobiae bacterium]|nr:2-hydroxyacid dehydrogenase [Verrucomicrobiae bacterium]